LANLKPVAALIKVQVVSVPPESENTNLDCPGKIIIFSAID
jgi:hypothetical protein